MATVTGNFEWEVVGIPLVKGVDLNTRARLVAPDNLLKAENVYFPRRGGPEKRRGHVGYTVIDKSLSSLGNPPSDNLYGYGLFDSTREIPTGGLTSGYAHAGTIKELMTRDNEIIAWDGHRLYSHFSNGQSKVTTACLPSYESEDIGKSSNTQNYSDCADNGRIRVVAYLKYPGPTAEAKVYDSVTGALKFSFNIAVVSAGYTRVVNTGAYVHVICSDITDEAVFIYTVHEDDNSITTSNSVAGSTSGVFDFWKFDETKFLIASRTTAGAICFTWINANGSTNTTNFGANFLPSITGAAINLAVAVHPTTLHIGLVWDVGANQYYRAYDQYGTALFAAVNFNANSEPIHFAICPSYVVDNFRESVFYVYYDAQTGAGTKRTVITRYLAGSSVITTTRQNVTLASRAFRVGNNPFVWCVYKSTLQTTYFLMDRNLLPIGKAEYGTAKENIADIGWLPSVNFIQDANRWNIYNFHGSLLYNRRIDLETPGTGTTFAETSTKFYKLDFLPELSWAQAGRCLYIAGAQLWAYDGTNLYEANFHQGVENDGITYAPSVGAGSLTLNGKYRWRIDRCHKNAYGEEVRSASFLLNEQTLTGGQNTMGLTWPHEPTRRTDSYYLVFRNENNGTAWYLCSSRDPQSAPAYSTSLATVTFSDTMSDTSLIAKEQHPSNASGYLEPISAPACQHVVFGRDRLWLAGGEMLPGEIMPSRLFYPGQVPSFNYALSVQVDRNDDPITGMAFQSDYTVAFKRNATYIVSGPISNNILQLTAPFVQLALADTGCINHKSIVRLTSGIAFQSISGYRLIGTGGGLEDIGSPVDVKAGNCVGAVLCRNDDHVRFYQNDNDTLVLDYRDGLWSTFVFNNKPNAAITSPVTGLAVIAVDNNILFEDDSVSTDNGFDFYYTIKTAWLADKIGGFQRVRRLYCIGEKEGIPPAVTIRIYTNMHDWYDQQITWEYAQNMNTDAYGIEEVYGEAFWGDTTPQSVISARDDIWKWRRRLKKQKCECISIELTDNGVITPTSKWIPVAFALEIGKKPGIDRLGNRTFTER